LSKITSDDNRELQPAPQLSTEERKIREGGKTDKSSIPGGENNQALATQEESKNKFNKRRQDKSKDVNKHQDRWRWVVYTPGTKGTVFSGRNSQMKHCFC